MLAPIVVGRRVMFSAGSWCRRPAPWLAGAGVTRPAPAAAAEVTRLTTNPRRLTRGYGEEAAVKISQRKTSVDTAAVTVRLEDGCLMVRHPDCPVDEARLSLIWLRDHCRCHLCYNHTTCQRETDVSRLIDNAKPLHFNVNSAGTTLQILWRDRHQSEYSLQWIWENSHIGSRHREQRQNALWQRRLWDAGSSDTPDRMVSVSHGDFMSSEEGVRRLLKGFLTDGVATVTEVAASPEATRQVVERLGVVQQTLFGGLWQFTADGQHADSAYSRQELLPHTDGTYFNEPPGVQVFHCLHHDGSGGDTTLVDGFACLQHLFTADRAAYRLLSDHPWPGEYRDPARGLHLIGGGPVIWHRSGGSPHPSGLRLLRFNPYDRAAVRRGDPAVLEPLYAAYSRLARLLWEPHRRRLMSLRPGTVLFIDNWRVLHGRAAFTGRRHMCGAYVARNDVISRARTAGLII